MLSIYLYCVGLLPITIGVIVYFLSSYAFVFSGKGTPIPSAPPKELVVTGLYRYVRNPMYTAGFFVLVGEILLFQSKGLLIYFLVLFGIFNILVVATEEPRLKKGLENHTIGTANLSVVGFPA